MVTKSASKPAPKSAPRTISKRPKASIRFEVTLGLVFLAFTAGILTGAWWEADITSKAADTSQGIINLVGNIRQNLDKPQMGSPGAYSDITDVLIKLGLTPPELLVRKDQLQTAWETPLGAALNRGSAIPVIEITASGLSTRECRRLVTLATKRYHDVNDLRSVWVGPPGVTLSSFPVDFDHTGCAGSNIKVVFQYQLQRRSF